VIRAFVCRDAHWLGVELDDVANLIGGPCISAETSRVTTWVIPTDEEAMIALHTRRVLGSLTSTASVRSGMLKH
jgi:acetate kinase